MKTSLFVSTALAALLVTGMASAAKKNYHSAPSGENELDDSVTPHVKKDTNSALAPDADFTVDTDAKTICGKVTLTAKPDGDAVVTGMHVHKGAELESDPTPLLALPTPTEITTTFNFKNVPAEILTTITTGSTYLNLHTAAFPKGAVRDQLAEGGDGADCEGTAKDLGGDGDTDAGASSSSSSSGSTPKGDAGTSGTSGTTATPSDTADSGGCSTTGSSSTGSGLAIAAGLGLVLAGLSRKRNKKS